MQLATRYKPTTLEDVRTAAAWAARVGVRRIWTSEAAHNPFVLVPLIADEAPDVQVGTGIAVAFARSPFVTAQVAWDLQRYSRGRFTLGLGSQVKSHVERRFSQPWHDDVLGQMRDYVACLRRIWANWQHGVSVDHDGPYYRMVLHNPEFTPGPLPGEGHMPVWLAGVGPRMIDLAVEMADGLHVHAFHTEATLRASLIPAVDRHRDRRGLVGTFPATTPTLAGVAHDDAQAGTLREEFRRHVAFYASTPSYLGVLETEGATAIHEPLRALARQRRWDDMAAMVDDDLLDRFAIIGPAREVGRRLAVKYDGVLTEVSLYRGGDQFMDEQDWHELGESVSVLPRGAG